LSISPAIDKRKKSFNRAKKALYEFLPDSNAFISPKAFAVQKMYFPLCGVNAESIKSSITPRLGGDIKIDKNRYLTKPASAEDLWQGLRNFFCIVQGKSIVSLVGGNKNDACIEAGMLWHQLTRRYAKVGIELGCLNFVPVTGEHVELMRVTVKNISKEKLQVSPIFSLPLFGRTLANKHDHEHVTSLLNRIEQHKNGICVEPTMIFDERGHQTNENLYYVLGKDSLGNDPIGTYPTAENFYGDGGNISTPEAVIDDLSPSILSSEIIQGKEAVGAIRFKQINLNPGESCDYLIVMGIDSSREQMNQIFARFNSLKSFKSALKKNKIFWEEKIQTIRFSTADETFNTWMQWVTLQPMLRRIFGCSFLPEHDYGKGGKGWRDIWQDLLSLILIEPENIRNILVNNFAGVRIDGSNATIIGSAQGEFLADRNFLTRVWMDHGVWPFMTLLLYINQTGDYDVLFEENTYFRDVQLSRTFEKDFAQSAKKGNFLNDKNVQIYKGTLIEHILVQHLVQFFNVGEHNITRLEDADWNDGLDMAKERGESVAFMSFYGGNLLAIADLLEILSETKGIKKINLAAEVVTLLDTLTNTPLDYDNVQVKEKFLFEVYFPSVQPEISGKKVLVLLQQVVSDLRKKGNWIFKHIRNNEKIVVEHDNQSNSWFNGYYDNKGNRVEGIEKGRVRMTLAGQVFPIISGLADKKDIEDIIQAVNQHLQDKQLGGFRLNTDFGIPHYMELGRAFGFAYGTKENGAFFSHMTVMYGFSLYKRGFVREGYTVLRSIYQMCMDTEKSKIYPGIPEYFDSEGRGYYHYLTGAASWLVLTQLTQVFGVRGNGGDLIIEPKLVKEEFDPKSGQASVVCYFAGKKISVTFENPKKLDTGDYGIGEVFFNDKPAVFQKEGKSVIRIKRELFEGNFSECVVRVILMKM